MKYSLLVGPVAALLAATAFAQTETATQGAGTSSDRFGTTWPSTAADAFFDESRTMRDEEEITSRWQMLPQSDRDMIEADCRMFLQEHGDTAAGVTTPGTDATSGAGTDTAAGTATTSPATGATSEAGTDTAAGTGAVDETTVEGTTQTAGTTESGSSDAGSSGAATTGSADATMMAGFDLSEMREICEAIEEG